jgi:trk system potassium uptake protein TrkH
MNQKYKYGKIIVAAYGGLGLLGTLLLLLPCASTQPGSISFVQAWVTSISALTVTGLTVVNTGNHWSLFGQTVILILIQIGGLGLIVLTTLLLVILGYRLNLGYRIMVSQEQRRFDFSGVRILFRNILLLVLAIELLGALFLCLVWPNLWEEGIGRGLFTALFHSVSGFNGAGFDITGHSLLPYREAIGINLIMMTLIFLGSLGYVVLLELIGLVRHRHRLTLHSRLVLVVTGVITLGGSCFYWLTEYTSSLAGLTWGQKIVESLFQCVTRTAGFVTVPVESWNEPFLFLMIIMMFIGASPGSVGGGIVFSSYAVQG